MVGIGVWSKSRIRNVIDFFTAGGRIPWWLSGISHHMSGYSTIMFVAFAAIVSWAVGLGVWAYVKWIIESKDTAMVVGLPLVTSLILYVAIGLLRPENRQDRDALVDSLSTDPEPERAASGR